MRSTLTLLVFSAGLISAVANGAAVDEPRTFDGHYRWDATGDSGSLYAVFTPTGEGTFDVAFQFNFQGAHTFRGTADGSLEQGRLTGTVSDERGDRSFAFRGTFNKGKFRGSHFEVTGGGRRKTGSVSFREGGRDDPH